MCVCVKGGHACINNLILELNQDHPNPNAGSNKGNEEPSNWQEVEKATRQGWDGIHPISVAVKL